MEEFSEDIEERLKEVVHNHKVEEKKKELAWVITKNELKKWFTRSSRDSLENIAKRMHHLATEDVREALSYEQASSIDEDSISDILDAYLHFKNRDLSDYERSELEKILVMLNKRVSTMFDKIGRYETELFTPFSMQRLAYYTPYAFDDQIMQFFEGTDQFLTR